MRFFSCVPTLVLALGLASAAPELQVAYPSNDHRSNYDHIILEGHTSPGATLSIGTQSVPVGPDGLFMQWWPLRPGLNVLNMVATQGTERTVLPLRLTYNAPSSLPVRPSAIRGSSLWPQSPIELYGSPARDILVRFQASPGGRATVRFGTQPAVAMPEESATATQGKGWYSATLSAPAGTYGPTKLQFSFTGRDGKTLHAVAPGQILSNAAPRVATVIAADIGQGVNPATTSFDTGPGAHDQLFPRQGEQLVVWRKDRDGYTVQGIGGTALAPKAALSLLSANTPLPAAQIGTPLLSQTDTEWQVRWPLGTRVLFDIAEGQIGGKAALSLKLATSAGVGGELLTQPQQPAVRWTASELDVALPQSQLWGYWAAYEGSDLVLHIRKAPTLNPAQPMQGRVILIDPGHGADELGGAGSLGVPEKDMVLPIARRVVELLRAQGADARLTRDHDQKVGLYDRDLMAEQLGADLLVSIHANALPDGIDPRTHKGLEVHTFHPMTYGLVNNLLRAIPASVPGLNISSASSTERDPAISAGLMVSNLALTRPSTQRSILIETAYLTDPQDLRLLMSPAGQEAFAQGIAAGIAADYAAQASPTATP